MAVKVADVSAQNTSGLLLEILAVGADIAIVIVELALDVPAVAEQV